MRRVATCVLGLIVAACSSSASPPQQTTKQSPASAEPPPPAKNAPRTQPAPTPTMRSRAKFAKAMAKVRKGMHRDKVRELLGAPDDVRTVRDPGGITATRTVEIWRYGTAGHLTFATLGTVHLMASHTVQYVFGGKPAPAVPLMAEAKLRQLLRLLARAPSYNAAHRYNPVHVIRAVNALQPLGKAKALAVIAEFLRVSSSFEDPGRAGMFLVLRTLFGIPTPPGFQRGMMVGAALPRPPKDLRKLPRFPVVIVDDVPLLLVTGYMLAGMAEPPAWHVKYFRKVGTMRRKLLRPTNKLFQLANRLAGSASTAFLKRTGANRAHIINQLVLLGETVVGTQPDRFGARFSVGPGIHARWQKLFARAIKRPVVWNVKTQRYTYTDGTSRAIKKPATYRREIWKLTIAGASEAVLTLQRVDKRYVAADLRITMPNNAPIPAIAVVLRRSNGGTVLARLNLGKPGAMSASAGWRAGTTSGAVITKQLGLAINTTIFAELSLANAAVNRSPPMVP